MSGPLVRVISYEAEYNFHRIFNRGICYNSSPQVIFVSSTCLVDGSICFIYIILFCKNRKIIYQAPNLIVYQRI